MNKRLCAAVVAVVALTAGCAGEPAAAPPPSTTTTTTTTPPPAPAELNERAKAAIAPPGAFASIGGEVQDSMPASDTEIGGDGEIVITVCGGSGLRVDGTSVARTRTWAGRVNLFQRVHAMSERTAATLVASMPRSISGCAAARGAAQLTTLAKPAGVDDFFAHCEANVEPGLVPWSCLVLMGRGTLITLVVASDRTRAAAEAQLTAVLPIFAEPFAKA